jgi:Ca-activated chloride channel family protein
MLGKGGKGRTGGTGRKRLLTFLPFLPFLPLLPFLPFLPFLRLHAQDPIRDNRPLKSGIEVISVAATVRDSEGRLVTGLDRDVFDVFEDGERQTISQFTSERVPIGLGVLLDTSDSMYGKRIQNARTAVNRFLFELLDPADEFFILAFNHEPHLITTWTSSPDVVRAALDGVRPSGGTAAYDAVLASLPLIGRRNRERAAILLISDGADTASSATLRDVRSALSRSDAFAYAIAIDPPETRAINTRVNPTALREITDDSGGRTEVVRNIDDLVTATARIAEELNHQYVLGYTSPRGADGQFHSIRVRIRGSEYRVRARNGYVATPSKKSE